MLVRVKDMWLNPDKVVGIWYEHLDDGDYWRVILRCLEKTSWQWEHDSEEDASRMCDELAAQVNPGGQVDANGEPCPPGCTQPPGHQGACIVPGGLR